MFDARRREALRVSITPGPNCPDPIGCCALARADGFICNLREDLQVKVAKNHPAASLWASFWSMQPPILDGSPEDLFVVMQNCSFQLFRLLVQEFGTMRHPRTNETFFHVCCGRSDSVEASLQVCFAAIINPFTPSAHGGLRAVDLLEQKSAKKRNNTAIAMLKQYSVWRPRNSHWFGPYFQMRAFAFLLCTKRLNCAVKDVRYLIVQYIALSERLYYER